MQESRMDGDYVIFLLIGVAITLWASYNIKATFKKYSQLRYTKNATAEVVANWILKQNGITNVRIARIPGSLTDHYDPTQKVLRLSDSVYGSVSMAAIGVAAHECGHAIQDHIAYKPMMVRRELVPIANLGSTISYPIILLGIFFGATGLLNVGIILFSSVVVFQLVTLPVEFDASKRACAILEGSRRFSPTETDAVKKVLFAAAMTYLASAMNSILQLMRLLNIARRR